MAIDFKSILGDAHTDGIETAINKAIGAEFVSKANYDGKNEELKAAKSQLDERDRQLAGLKAMKPEELAAKISELETANKTAMAEYESQLAGLRKQYALEAALLKAGAVNSKAVSALLDHGKISLDGDNLIGLDEQIKSLRESDKWAFADTAPPAGVTGTGGNPPTPGAKTPPAGGVCYNF